MTVFRVFLKTNKNYLPQTPLTVALSNGLALCLRGTKFLNIIDMNFELQTN
jgi:hypothetical protein